jgi:hypothetical protein
MTCTAMANIPQALWRLARCRTQGLASFMALDARIQRHGSLRTGSA